RGLVGHRHSVHDLDGGNLVSCGGWRIPRDSWGGASAEVANRHLSSTDLRFAIAAVVALDRGSARCDAPVVAHFPAGLSHFRRHLSRQLAQRERSRSVCMACWHWRHGDRNRCLAGGSGGGVGYGQWPQHRTVVERFWAARFRGGHHDGIPDVSWCISAVRLRHSRIASRDLSNGHDPGLCRAKLHPAACSVDPTAPPGDGPQGAAVRLRARPWSSLNLTVEPVVPWPNREPKRNIATLAR